MTSGAPFVFCTERKLVLLTGVQAMDLRELLAGLLTVPGSSIFHHTHQQYLAHHFEKPGFNNDFALWASRALLEERLAEQLAAVDILGFTTVRELREALVAVVTGALAENGGRTRDAVAGNAFHFCRSRSFVMPTGHVAADVPSLFTQVANATNISLHFHFVTARLRLERPSNDFSCWLRDRGRPELAQALERLDPYRLTLDELREEICRVARNGKES